VRACARVCVHFVCVQDVTEDQTKEMGTLLRNAGKVCCSVLQCVAV